MPVTEAPTPNLFWGIVLKADKRYEQTVEECFHISKACIEPTLNNGKVCSVYLEQDNEEFILCNLSQKNLNESLDLNFTEGEKICFRVEGGGTVHLTGYLVPDEDDDGPMFPMDDMSDLEEEEEEEEETPPQLIKKRKLENGDSPKAKSKKEAEIKQANAMKKILENQSNDSDEESDDDDDSDDEDMDDSELKSGSSFFDTTNDDSDEEEEDSDEDDDDDEDVSEDLSDDDSKIETPNKKTPKKEEKKTPNGNTIKQKNETPKSLKKEKTETPKSNKAEKKLETPNPKKENKADTKTETPATGKKDKKNKQLLNGVATNGSSTPAAQTPKNKDAKTPQANQTPAKTPKKQLKGGLMVEDLKIGNGPEAKSGKLVGMYYEGKLKSNNKQFDAQKQGKPFRFRLGRGEVIKGWDVGVEGMKVGGKRRLTCPPNMGYGSQGAPPDIPPNATLVFEVECKMVN